MQKRFPSILKLWPILEIMVFVIVGLAIGFGWALLLLVAISLLGLLLLRKQGLANLKNIKQNDPAAAMSQILEKSLLTLSGLLLFIPGFITGFLGLLCLVPGLRRSMIKRFFKQAMPKPGRPAQNDDKTIEGECWHDDQNRSD
jgi:UPF0716 protein FxsA